MPDVHTTAFKDAPTRHIEVESRRFAYRDLGPRTGAPLSLLNHLGATLDNCDPRVVDGLAARRRVIAFDNRGVGASGPRFPGRFNPNMTSMLKARARVAAARHGKREAPIAK